MFHSRAIYRFFVCILLVLIVFSTSTERKVEAHAYSASYTKLNFTKASIEMTYALDELSVIELTNGDLNNNGILELEEFDAVKEQFLTLLKNDIKLEINNETQEWNVESFTINRDGDSAKAILKVTFPPALASQTVSLTDNLYITDKVTANYVDLVTINYGEKTSTSALSGNYRVWSMEMSNKIYDALRQDPQSQSNGNEDEAGSKPISGWFSFFKLGMTHILEGYDHLLFLFSLLIARQTFKQYATMITAFTIAHSITLSLTVLGFINVPGWFVEPAIALSICYVAVENIVRKKVSYRWILTFIFGLIHGMGFADILIEMDIPRSELATDLISFNLGIETIQVTLVAILLMPLVLLHRWKFSRRVVISGSAIAFILGAYWLVSRVFFS